jgi:hypothetical protein
MTTPFALIEDHTLAPASKTRPSRAQSAIGACGVIAAAARGHKRTLIWHGSCVLVAVVYCIVLWNREVLPARVSPISNEFVRLADGSQRVPDVLLCSPTRDDAVMPWRELCRF